MTDGGIDAVSHDWLESLLFEAEQAGVGAVGPHITGPDGRMQSAGCILGLDRWETAIEAGDPFYNPNLNLSNGGFGLAFPPR